MNRFGFVAFENLRIKNMLQDHRLAKSIADAAWRQLTQYPTYKAENAGRVVGWVEPRNTSQQCSGCGALVVKSLDVQVHAYPIGGLLMDRDQNAAIHILRPGLESPGFDPGSPRLWAWGGVTRTGELHSCCAENAENVLSRVCLGLAPGRE